MMKNNLLQSTPHHLSETHFVFGCDPFSLPKESIWNLNLRFSP